MQKPWAKGLVIAALIVTTGAQWVVLQTVAWTAMLAGNLRSHSLNEAVSATFDGRHPCCLCKAIAAARQSERKSEVLAPTLKLEFPLVADRFVLISPTPYSERWHGELARVCFLPKPPVPPPRLAGV